MTPAVPGGTRTAWPRLCVLATLTVLTACSSALPAGARLSATPATAPTTATRPAADAASPTTPGANHPAASAQANSWHPVPADGWPGHGLDVGNPAACDPLDPAQCLLPYPNDWFTKPDPASATGRRLDLTLAGMPRNAEGKPIEPQEWNRSDGFSAGAQILTLVPGMTSNDDLVPSGLPPVTDPSLNDQPDPGVVLLDTQTGGHVPVWVEVDQYTQESGAASTGTVQQDLMIHPAVNLSDGHRYIVALRHLHTDDGSQAEPSAAFKAYRDGTASAGDTRTAHMEHLFATLQLAGVGRSDLYLAWDFTTASTRNVTGRLLAIRDDAFHQLGDSNLADGAVQGSESPQAVADQNQAARVHSI